MRSHCSYRVITVSKTYNQFKIIRSIYEPTSYTVLLRGFNPLRSFFKLTGGGTWEQVSAENLPGSSSDRFPLFHFCDSNSMSVHRPSGDNFRWRGRTQSSFIRMALASQIKVGGGALPGHFSADAWLRAAGGGGGGKGQEGGQKEGRSLTALSSAAGVRPYGSNYDVKKDKLPIVLVLE